MLKGRQLLTRKVLTYRQLLELQTQNFCQVAQSQRINDNYYETQIKKDFTYFPDIKKLYFSSNSQEQVVRQSGGSKSQVVQQATKNNVEQDSEMTPQELVQELDKFIIGQKEAKRAVANAVRNRWRRHRVSEQDMKQFMTPKNILMIGPTGVGKTEIARTIAKIISAPFVKVEATKFTELGFYGDDVDKIIDKLVDNAVQLTRQRHLQKFKDQVQENVKQQIIEILAGQGTEPSTREDFLNLYNKGALDNMKIIIDVVIDRPQSSISNPFNIQYAVIRNMSQQRTEKREVTIAEAKQILEEKEGQKLLDEDKIQREAIQIAQQDGIVFIDEIDKIVIDRNRTFQADASSEGVQKDLLPIIEGSLVATQKYGQINTDHILFICSGAFTTCKPSDMLAELLGRLPIRVNLEALRESDFARILQEPKHNLLRQQQLLLGTEGVDVQFSQDGISQIAQIAQQMNLNQENIGARRLHTIIEKIMDDLSFNAPMHAKEAKENGEEIFKQIIDQEYIQKQVGDLLEGQDLQKYVI